MEEMLKQLLEGQRQLFEGQKQLFEGQRQLFEGQQQLFDGQKQLFDGQQQLSVGQKQLSDGQKQLFEEVASIKSELGSMNNRLESVEKEMVTKSDMEENTRILRALEHASQVNAAEIENLKHTTASKEFVQKGFSEIAERLDGLQTDLSYAVEKITRQDRSIVQLSKHAR